jgi:hypothetical protein
VPVGYSGKPLPTKLGIKPGMSLIVLGAPPDYETLMADLPAGVTTRRRLGGTADVVLLFTTRRLELARRVPALMAAIAPAGAVWVCWPKRASRVPTDITEDVIREVVLPSGLVDVKVCAVSEVWSGLKLVIRRELR